MKFYRTTTLNLICLAAAAVTAQDNFVPIGTSVPQNVVGVRLPATCSDNYKVPKTMFTVEPSATNNVTILSSPPNLVTAFVDSDSLLGLRFDRSAEGASEGGVRIQMPNAKFTKLDASISARGQVLEGFTALQSIVASTSSSIQAVVGASNFTSGTPLKVTASTSAYLGVQCKAGIVAKATADTSATLTIVAEGGIVEKSTAGTSARLNIVAARVKDVDVSTSASSEMKLDTPIESGTVSTSGSLTVSAAGSCDNLDINTSGNCKDDSEVEDFEVTVGTEFTLTGTQSCPTTSSASTGFGSLVMAQVVSLAAAWLALG